MSKLGVRIGVVACVVALSSVIAGCGVSQQEVDAIAADRDALTTQLADAQGDLATVTEQRDTLSTASEETKQELSSLTSKYEQLQSVSDEWETRAKTAEQERDDWEARAKTAEQERDVAHAESQQATADLNAILLGQHDVQGGKVIRGGFGDVFPLHTIVCGINGVALFQEAPLYDIAKPPLIFNNQNSHAQSPGSITWYHYITTR